MDTDGSGTLTNADLVALAESEAAKAKSRVSLMAAGKSAATNGERLPDEIPMGAVAENV